MAGFGDLDALDDYLGGMLSQAAGFLAEGHTSKLFGFIRDDLAGRAGLEHERRNGLLTPEAEADRTRREAIGRQAAMADAMNRGPELEVTGGVNPPAAQPQSTGRAAPGCMRGVHRFGTLRGANGEAECMDCGTTFVCPS